MMKITIGGVVQGGSSLNYETGNWRDQKPIIDQEACTVCGICMEVCPDSAIHTEQEKYVIDYVYCKGCGLCAFECPSKAIKMIKEEK